MHTMRWFPVLLLAYIAIGIQAGISGEVRVHGFGPNLGLLVVVFVALGAPREPALLACVLIGAMQDLATQQAPGLYALSYGMVGYFVVGLQSVVYRDHPLTHAMLVLIGGIITGLVIWIHGRIVTPLYTAILAAPVLMMLQRSRRVFGMHAMRRGRGAF
jgi:rod shape-determining protein MreD